ncbi:MAG TPA: DNA polymerase IV, partial [Microbacterium sp.]|nr:DNA polymerase IV [Microbacterium sp.]
PSSVGQRIGDVALELFEGIDQRLPVRLVGVRAEKLRTLSESAPALWDDDGEWRRVESALDTAAARFGRGAITRATLISERGGGTLPSNPRLSRDDPR